MRMHMRNAQWKPGACHGTRHMVLGVRVARGARWLAVGRRRGAGATRAVARGGAERRGQAACPLGPMERRGARHGTAGTGGGRRQGGSMGRCMGGAHERDLGALQRKSRILHLLARHLHLCRVARRACQREVRRCACRANPNRGRAWTRRDRSELLARRPKAVELRLGPRFQGVRRSILCHGRRGGVRGQPRREDAKATGETGGQLGCRLTQQNCYGNQLKETHSSTKNNETNQLKKRPSPFQASPPVARICDDPPHVL